jgi:hypothetical protein
VSKVVLTPARKRYLHELSVLEGPSQAVWPQVRMLGYLASHGLVQTSRLGWSSSKQYVTVTITDAGREAIAEIVGS